jgi:sterol desaturase/sphingolipid hydroxylase (fatty acid hydroxylase superfamily)
MGELLVHHEAVLYGCVWFGGVALAAALEGVAPRRTPTLPLRARWLRHFALALLDPLVARAVLPLLEVGAAVAAAEAGVGLFHRVDAPRWLAGAASLLALDAVRYGQHRLLHRVPWLWRVHRMHHTDVDYDFTTAFRFHPLESLVTASIGVLAVTALGAPVEAVVANEALFVAASLFAHANVRLPGGLDRAIRLAVVTPDMHRVHHSARPEETDSNYGSVLPVWDRLLGTYVAEPAQGHEAMTVGLPAFRAPRDRALRWMLANPFLPEPRGPQGSSPSLR